MIAMEHWLIGIAVKIIDEIDFNENKKGSSFGADASGLFHEWLKIEMRGGESKTRILKRLNDACGTRYGTSWISRNSRNLRGMERSPAAVRRYMVRLVLTDKLSAYHLSAEQIEQFVNWVL